MSVRDLSAATWHKSSRSNGNGGNNCVEVTFLDNDVAVRDGKGTQTSAVVFTAARWGRSSPAPRAAGSIRTADRIDIKRSFNYDRQLRGPPVGEKSLSLSGRPHRA